MDYRELSASAKVVTKYAVVSAVVVVGSLSVVRERANGHAFSGANAERLGTHAGASGTERSEIDRRITVIFQPADCSGVLESVLQVLNDLDAELATSVNGLLIPPGDGEFDLSAFATSHGVQFRLDLADYRTIALLFKQLGYENTPLALVFGPEGELRSIVDGPRVNQLGSLLGGEPSS